MNVFSLIGTAFGAVFGLLLATAFVGRIIEAFKGSKSESVEVMQEREKWKRIVIDLVVIIVVLVGILYWMLSNKL